MTRCYEYYCLFENTPERCELKTVRGRRYVERYIRFMKEHGVVFDKEPKDKQFFLELQAAHGTERGVFKGTIVPQPSRVMEPLPAGVFNVVYADPPWQYEFSWERGDPEKYYTTLSVPELSEMELPTIAEDAVLFLWATNPKLREALIIMAQWGFEYKTNMVWVKDKFGTGYYVRGQHELLLIGKKGTLPVPSESTRPSSVIEAPRTEHSAKPLVAYELIERMYPDHQYIELFARQQRDGWEAWGDQLETTVQ